MAEAGMNSRMCYTAVVLGNHAVEHVDTQYSIEASHGLIHGFGMERKRVGVRAYARI